MFGRIGIVGDGVGDLESALEREPDEIWSGAQGVEDGVGGERGGTQGSDEGEGVEVQEKGRVWEAVIGEFEGGGAERRRGDGDGEEERRCWGRGIHEGDGGCDVER